MFLGGKERQPPPNWCRKGREINQKRPLAWVADQWHHQERSFKDRRTVVPGWGESFDGWYTGDTKNQEKQARGMGSAGSL